MSVGYIAAAKDLTPVTVQPLILVEVAYYNFGNPAAVTARFSSHMLSASLDGGGGFAYGGHDYQPRIMNTEDLTTILMSESGIDQPQSASIVLADPDGAIWNTYELPIGFKGATVTIKFVLWDANTSDFSTDSIVRFIGTSARAEMLNDPTIRFTVTSKLQMNLAQVPSEQIQPTCLWNFPMSAAQRQDAKDNDASPCFECGYSPDSTGPSPVGNYAATTTLGGNINGVVVSVPVGSVTGTLPATPFPACIGAETVIVTAAGSSPWTVVRGSQGTVGISHTSGGAIVVPYSSCNKTRSDCMLRLGKLSDTSFSPDGNISVDNSNRSTARFSGILFKPPSTLTVRPYITGKWEQIVNNANLAKYGDLVPIVYGTTWVNGLVLFTSGDGNYTSIDVIVGRGQIAWVYHVVVNGVKIPHSFGDPMLSQVPAEMTDTGRQSTAGGWWSAVNDGRRNGRLMMDLPFLGKGDPYGSLAVLNITAPAQLVAPNSTPTVQVLLDGPKLRIYTDPTTYTFGYTSNPAWVIMDQLFWAGWQEGDLDIQSFIDASAKYGTQISFIDITGAVSNSIPSMRPGGSAVPYAKYDTSLTLRTRTSASDVLRGLRNNCKSLLVPDRVTGKLQLIPKETLASQQGSVMQLNGHNASNYNTGIPSITVDAISQDGYAAYNFTEADIAYNEGTHDSSFRILPQGLGESPNSLSLSFQNAENQFNTDSLTLVETEDQLRINAQPIVSGPSVYGVNTFDRARRALATLQAEILRGNPRNAIDGQTIGDTGGTYGIEFETSFKAIHLRVGDIVRVTYQPKNIIGWLFRMTGIFPGFNAERLRLQMHYHNDAWYMDTFGQTNAPAYRLPQGNNARPPRAWAPYGEQPQPGNSIYYPTDWSYRLSNYYVTGRDNTSIGHARIVGRKPVNSTLPSPLPPIAALQATSATTGGTIPGDRTYFILVSAKNVSGADYKPSEPSLVMAQVRVPATTDTNTITIPITFWDGPSEGYIVFAGTHPQKLTYQTDADFTPGSGPLTITLTAYNETGWPAPDSAFDHLRFYITRGWHTGVAGFTVDSCTSSTIDCTINNGAGFEMGTNQFQNYDVSLAGLSDAFQQPSEFPLPIFDCKVASNDGNTLTLGAGLDGLTPDPTSVPRGDGTFGLQNGDILVMNSKITVGSDSDGNYIEDPNWENEFGSFQSPQAVTGATNANPMEITTAGNHGYSTGDRVFVNNLNGMSGYTALLYTITVTASDKFTIPIDTTSAGAYTGSGGISRRINYGLTVNEERGRQIIFFKGPISGAGFSIKSNTKTRLYIVGDWPNGVAPDSTSRYWIVESDWKVRDGSRAVNDDPTTQIQTEIDIPNFNLAGMVTMVTTVNAAGQESLIFDSPKRAFFVMGNPGNLTFAGSMAIQINDVLAIGSDQGPRSFFNVDTTVKAVRVAVKQAPIGADLVIKIYTDTNDLVELTIADGTTEAEASDLDIASMVTILAQQDVKVDLIAVGTTFGGADLSVGIFF